MPHRHRPDSADSLRVHQPRFHFCEPENPSPPPPPPPPPPAPPPPPPTIDELLSRARAQRRRAIREEDFDFIRRLDADIERLQSEVAQRGGGGKQRGMGPTTDLERLLDQLDEEVLYRTKRPIFGTDSTANGDSSGLDEAGKKNDATEDVKKRGRGGEGVGHGAAPMPTARIARGRPGAALSDLEQRADQLDRLLERTLAGGVLSSRRLSRRPPPSPPFYLGNHGIGWKSPSPPPPPILHHRLLLPRRPSSSFLLRRSESGPSAAGHPLASPHWEEGDHMGLLAQIRRFDAEMGLEPAKWTTTMAMASPPRRLRRASSTLSFASSSPLFFPNSPPILSKHTANWVQKYGGGGWQTAGGGGIVGINSRSPSPFAPPGAGNRRAPHSPPSDDSSWSTESPFAPPKGFHHQRKAKKTRRPSIPLDSPRLPTPPGLKDDGQQTSPPPPETPLVDREQFLLEINPADRGFASRAIDLFGLETMANIYAKDWAERKAGIERMLGQLREAADQEGQQGKEAEMLERAIPVLKRALQDPLFQVFSAGMALFLYLLVRLSSVPPADARIQRKLASATAVTLANRIGDRPNDKRFGQLSLDAFDRVFAPNADKKMANFFLLQLFLIAQHSGGQPEFSHLELGHAQAVAKGVRTLWGTTGASSTSEYRLCPFIGLYLASPDPDIRAIGRGVAEWIYARGTGTSRRLIRRLLPVPAEEDVTARAKADFRQLHMLHARWDEIDNDEGDDGKGN